MKIGNKKKRTKNKIYHIPFRYKDFLKMYNYCTREPYSFMTIDARPTATMVFRKNFTEFSYKN